MALHYFLKRAGFTTEEVPSQAKVRIEGVDNGMRQASRVGALERKGAQAHSRRYSNEAYTCAHATPHAPALGPIFWLDGIPPGFEAGLQNLGAENGF